MHIIGGSGRRVMRVIITMNDKGQVNCETESNHATLEGVTVKNQAHPLLLVDIFAKLAAGYAEKAMQLQQGGNSATQATAPDNNS